MNSKGKKDWLQGLLRCIVAIACSACVAVCVAYVLLQTGLHLQGSNLYEQLYKLDMVGEAMREGRYSFLYTEHWYNGYEIFRCSSPLSYMLVNELMQIFRVDVHVGICLFYGGLVFLSQMGFFLFGIREHKITAAFLTGIAFLFLPSTLDVVLLQGCLDLNMGFFLLPLLLFTLYDLVKWRRRWEIVPFSLLLGILIAAQYVLSIVVGIMVLIYLIIYGIANKSWRFECAAAADLLLVYVAMGYFLYPAISGGLLSGTYTQQETTGVFVGVPILVIAIVGLITADRSRCAGFLLTALGLLLSFEFMEPVVRLIPTAALRRTNWYVMVCLVICMITLLCWKRLRLIFLVLMLAVLVGSGFSKDVFTRNTGSVIAGEEAKVHEYLLEEAAAYTDNRVALIDMATLGAFPQWYFAVRDINSMTGWDLENALTVQNLMHVNEAFADGFYDYVFDRLRLYGNDVVIVLRELIPGAGDYEVMLQYAGRNGYAAVAENDKAVVLKAAVVNGTYGVITHYDNLAIGSYAAQIAYIYPSFGWGRSNVIEDYTVEELAQYGKLYLSGFTYRDKEKAENMLKELSSKGVDIYIDMQHIPTNLLSGKDEFMDVYAQFVQFTEVFPILSNDNGNEFKLDFQGGGYAVWDTVYISGCDTVLKESAYDNKSHLTYLGQNSEPNVTFMGFNLVYYYLTTHNADLRRFLDEAMDISSESLPDPEIVPIQIERTPGQIVVRTQGDKVNCNLASVECLEPDRIVTTEESLWVVNEGDTVFRIGSPGSTAGLVISIIGLIGLAIIWITVYVVLESDIKSKP
ncbi:MAG: 6-pyruvoyl-tetrahydropterin synthase-related protein [Roseburia sp.]|nr:6-pyruvoyl-tetrahydropterin synthase-related protein [Roseburia sp.]